MPAVPVTINGVAFPKNKKDPPYPVTIVGYAWVTGLAVGGGPVYPPQLPPGTPEHPIVLPPTGEHPEHPIVLPPDQPPIEPPDIPNPPTEGKPPPPDGGWGWSPDYGWGWFPGTGSAGPKRR
jgi:hypothetical protein